MAQVSLPDPQEAGGPASGSGFAVEASSGHFGQRQSTSRGPGCNCNSALLRTVRDGAGTGGPESRPRGHVLRDVSPHRQSRPSGGTRYAVSPRELEVMARPPERLLRGAFALPAATQTGVSARIVRWQYGNCCPQRIRSGHAQTILASGPAKASEGRAPGRVTRW